jgi:hypothetical protein
MYLVPHSSRGARPSVPASRRLPEHIYARAARLTHIPRRQRQSPAAFRLHKYLRFAKTRWRRSGSDIETKCSEPRRIRERRDTSHLAVPARAQLLGNIRDRVPASADLRIHRHLSVRPSPNQRMCGYNQLNSQIPTGTAQLPTPLALQCCGYTTIQYTELRDYAGPHTTNLPARNVNWRSSNTSKKSKSDSFGPRLS